MEMWNHPTCSKCAAARETLAAARVPVTLRAYLDVPPSAAELTDVLRRLAAEPWDICRVGEPAAVSAGMADWPRTPDARSRWIDAMVAHPELIQRPILLLDDGRAVVARSAEGLAEVVQAADEQPKPAP